MKKGVVFALGMGAGFILAIVLLVIISVIYANNTTNGITYSEQQTEFTVSDAFEVFQVVNGGALAHCQEKGGSFFTGPIVFIVSDGQNLFYDDQIIKVYDNNIPIQIGTYSYETNSGMNRTVPVIMFE